MLVVSHLCKSFQATVAADDVCFELAEGGSLGLVGESGSGKTTIARMLVGLETPDSGTISVAGRARGAKERGRAARLRRAREIQMVFQDPYVSLDPRLTAAECLHTALRLHGKDRSRAAELLDQVGLGSREAGARPHQLSGGQR
ncbi:MAG: ATP-binding cassette domain-containing protein, partial [Nonomuraea sp.]|nr:ATP-binding cassette domain-containing protein [Nonomuraea sp.]